MENFNQFAALMAGYAVHDAEENSSNGSWCMYPEDFPQEVTPEDLNIIADYIIRLFPDEVAEVSAYDECIDMMLYTSFCYNLVD